MGEVPFFLPGPAIAALRESDFDYNSAYGEVIDNSLQAVASEVKIRFATAKQRSRTNIQSVAFGDDGHGMDSKTLQRCLQAGFSTRLNDRTEGAIGRFGVGMTMGAIHEVKRVEVWSKQSGGSWNYIYVDLEEIEDGTVAGIQDPVERGPPPDMADLAGENSGTLVVWRKYDRQDEDGADMISKFRVWSGRTYRYFIWNKEGLEDRPIRDFPVRIWIQDEEVKAIDPLYVRTEKTAFPDDPVADLYADQEIMWKADHNAPNPSANIPITVRMSKLPVEFRQKQGDGGNEASRKRHIPMNEGISILRSHREVFYNEVPNWRVGKSGWSNFENIDRWWGCEVLFTPEVDRSFQVKHIKRGAIPLRNLKLAIKEKILPTRNTVIEAVREHWNTTKVEEKRRKEEEEAELLLKRAGDHKLAEDVVDKAPVGKSLIDKDKDLEEESKKASESYDRYTDDEQRQLEELFKRQEFTVMEENWRGPQFYESKFLGGRAVIDYNMNHIFWDTVYELVDQLDEPECDSEEIARKLRVMLDLIVISHAKAEAMTDPNVEYTAEKFIQTLRVNWGLYMDTYVGYWRKEEGEDNG